MDWKRIFRRKQKSNSGQCGMVLRADGIEWVSADGSSIQVDYKACAVTEREAALSQLIEEKGLQGYACQLVLTPGMYQILQVDRPSVPDEELASALRWSIKDLIAIPPEELVQDYYDSPVQSLGQAKLNVVACNKTLLQPLIDTLNRAKVDLVGISVEELALTSLVSDEAAQLILFHTPGDELLILIVKQQQLFFSRRLRGYNQIHQMSDFELEQGMLDNLSLELQRSMDYMQRQLRQEPVARVVIAIESPHKEVIVRGLQQNVEVPVAVMEIRRGEELLTNNLVAMGALEQLADQAEAV